MDVKQIYKVLTTIWPGGIPSRGLIPLAGMIKVLIDRAQEGVGVASTAQTELEQALATAATAQPSFDAIAKIGDQSYAVQHKTAPTISASGREMREKVYDYVSKNPGAMVTEISAALTIQIWAVGIHLRRLKKEGRLIPSADLVQKWRTSESINAPAKVPEPAPAVVSKARNVSVPILMKIKGYLSGGQLILMKRRTQATIAKDLNLGLWTVKRAIWQLQREGAVTRIKAVQGPHLYQLTK